MLGWIFYYTVLGLKTVVVVFGLEIILLGSEISLLGKGGCYLMLFAIIF
jgi:hypothetical protein